MKILLGAFAFAPHQGSEPGVGWRWAQELAREHEVVVLTDATRQALAAPQLLAHPVPGLQAVYHRPWGLRRVPLNSRTAPGLYALWQLASLPMARSLHRQHRFDLALHLTYGVFRHPSLLGELGIPFVFGPLGGGEEAPLALQRSLPARERRRERWRWLANRVASADPLLRRAFSRASLILAKTPQTVAALPRRHRERALVFPEVGIDAPANVQLRRRRRGEPLRALFAGRLLGWKGAHLALQAVAQARSRGLDVRLDIAGRGPCEADLRARVQSMGLGDAVRLLGHVPQPELLRHYARSHLFLFPSLHDSSGNVVLEAQSRGCPVVCLDLGGPATLVSADSASVVATAGADEALLSQRLADALQGLHAVEARRLRMAELAHAHAQRHSWRDRVRSFLDLLDDRGVVPQALR